MIQVLDENLSQTLSVGNSGVMSFDSSLLFATPWLSARSGFQKHYGQEIPEQGYSYLNEININFLGDQIARGSVFADLVGFFDKFWKRFLVEYILLSWCSLEKVFWKYAANLQENTYAKVRLQ